MSSVTTTIAGQLTDLPISHEEIIMQMIKSKYPISDFTPVKSKIYFSTMGYAGIKDYQISVEQNSSPFITPWSIGLDRIEKYSVPIVIHIWVRKNDDKKPQSIFTLSQKIEHIINTNTTNAGYGITSVRLVEGFATIEATSFFGGGGFNNQTEQSLWHTQAILEIVYFKSIIHTETFSVNKTHKYNVLV